jgi:hypothetical protein
MATASERLAALETAIDAFVAGGMVRSYKTQGIEITRENLSEMRKYRNELRSEVAAGKIKGLQLADLS